MDWRRTVNNSQNAQEGAREAPGGTNASEPVPGSHEAEIVPYEASMAEKLEPGIYDDVPEAVYHGWPLPHYSSLKHLEQSVELYVYYQQSPIQETAALVLGAATDCRILSGIDAYEELYAIAPSVDRRTKAGKETWAAFCEEAGMRTPLTRGVARSAHRCAKIHDRLLSHGPHARATSPTTA